MKVSSYPASFPNTGEEEFLRLVLASPSEFSTLWSKWSEEIVFDDLDPAMVRLLPLLSMRLAENKIESSLVHRIHGVYKFAWFKNQQLLAALSPILDTCRAKGIPVLLLKGIPLLFEVYKNTGARMLGDGDILIHSEDAQQVFDLLISAGWQHKDPSMVGLKKFRLDNIVHATTFVNDKGVHLEVHWHVYHVDLSANLARLILLRDIKGTHQVDYFWQDSTTVAFGGYSSLTPSITDLFVHVVVHGAAGNTRRPLRWVADAVWILRRHQVDWEVVLDRVERDGHIFHMQLAVDYLMNRFNITFPESFISSLQSKSVSKQSVRHYHKLANIYYAPLGNFPILWYRYWRYESEGSFWSRVLGFSAYLDKAWGFSPEDSLVGFIWQKYKKRIQRWVKNKSF